jgi:hypothetical protein
MLSIGGPIVISLFLLIINGAHYKGTHDASDLHKLQVSQARELTGVNADSTWQYTWRILMGIGIIIPLSVFYFR